MVWFFCLQFVMHSRFLLLSCEGLTDWKALLLSEARPTLIHPRVPIRSRDCRRNRKATRFSPSSRDSRQLFRKVCNRTDSFNVFFVTSGMYCQVYFKYASLKNFDRVWSVEFFLNCPQGCREPWSVFLTRLSFSLRYASTVEFIEVHWNE